MQKKLLDNGRHNIVKINEIMFRDNNNVKPTISTIEDTFLKHFSNCIFIVMPQKCDVIYGFNRNINIYNFSHTD